MTALAAFCSCPDTTTAERIARTLVEERLSACVNSIPGIVSTYRWQGEVKRDAEVLLLIKTTRARFEALRARILELHPYELPEVIAVDLALGHAPYLDWIARETTP